MSRAFGMCGWTGPCRAGGGTPAAWRGPFSCDVGAGLVDSVGVEVGVEVDPLRAEVSTDAAHPRAASAAAPSVGGPDRNAQVLGDLLCSGQRSGRSLGPGRLLCAGHQPSMSFLQ